MSARCLIKWLWALLHLTVLFFEKFCAWMLIERYYLVRAGESDYESMGIINTNPVAKTSVDNGLSEKGKKETIKAAFDLKRMGACETGCWIWPSITQRAYQAAEIIAAVNGVSRRYLNTIMNTHLLRLSNSWIKLFVNIYKCKCNQRLISECSNIVPEYSFLDARGLGAYEGKSLKVVSEVRSQFNWVSITLSFKRNF